MRDSTDLRKAAADALVAAREYSTTDAVRSVIKLMEAVEDQYKADLETVSVDDLVRVQTAIRQLSALRRAIVSNGYQDPKIL